VLTQPSTLSEGCLDHFLGSLKWSIGRKRGLGVCVTTGSFPLASPRARISVEVRLGEARGGGVDLDPLRPNWVAMATVKALRAVLDASQSEP
jgi:hypothetical protein